MAGITEDTAVNLTKTLVAALIAQPLITRMQTATAESAVKIYANVIKALESSVE